MPDTALHDDDIAVTGGTGSTSKASASASVQEFHKQDEKYAGPPPPPTNLSTYHSYHDAEWGPTRVRLHSFLTGREASGMKPIAGLTASILLEVAQIGYGVSPEGFEADAPGQAGRRERIAWEINRSTRFIDAVKREGIRWDWKREERKERQKRLDRLAHDELEAFASDTSDATESVDNLKHHKKHEDRTGTNGLSKRKGVAKAGHGGEISRVKSRL